jgi:hypothetical protein
MCEWQRTIDAGDRRLAETIHDGLFAVEARAAFRRRRHG